MKLAELALYGLIGGSLIAGAFVYGDQTGVARERAWWRAELAAKSGAVKELITRLGMEAEGLDVALIREIGGVNAKLEDAESTITRIRERGAPLPLAPDDPCRPVPAICLQRTGPGGDRARGPASGS